jgi:hypothetical protein
MLFSKIKNLIKKNRKIFWLVLSIRAFVKHPFALIELYFIYLKNIILNKRTVFFYFNDPLYLSFCKSVLEQAHKGKGYNTYIIIKGNRSNNDPNQKNIRYMEEKFRCVFLDYLPTSYLICDILITPSPNSISRLMKGKIIYLPHLPNKAMENIGLFVSEYTYLLNGRLEREIAKIVLEYKEFKYNPSNLGIIRDNGKKNESIEKVKIIFIIQTPSSWTSTESVWKSFNEDTRSEVQIIQLPFYHKNYDQADNETIGEHLNKKKIPFKYWYESDLENEKPDVVFFQNPYEPTRPPEFSFEAIEALGCKIAYIPYAFEILKEWPGTTMDYIDVISETPLLQKCWRLFVRSDRSSKMYSKSSSRGNEHIIVTGHPKIDFIVGLEKSKSDILKNYDKIVNKKVVLWNPNLGEYGGQKKWDIHFQILHSIEKYEDIIVIFRPHPLQLKKIRSNEKTDDLLFEKFKKLLLKRENIILDDSPDYRDSFILSDALITCASSLIFEYLATGKPIIFTPQAYPVTLNNDKDIIKSLYCGESSQDINQFFKLILDGNDPLREKRHSAIAEFIHSADGNSGNRIKEYIIKQLRS